MNAAKLASHVRGKYRTEGLRGVLHAIAVRLATVPGAPEKVSGTQASPLEAVLAWLAARDSFEVVQIGAYIGDTSNDPLYRFLRDQLPTRPSAAVVLLVEPVAEYFKQLQNAYRDMPGVRLENIAIAEREGERDFYRLGVDPLEHGLPAWLSQLGSLRTERVGDLWDNYEKDADLKAFLLQNRVTEKVQCATFHQLLDRHNLRDIDLLQIDAEGYDYEILRTVDFNRIRPRFINYERVLLQGDEPACRAMLTAAGYVLFDWGQDTLCVGVG